jgi:selenocysteine lyase/cysteine desulfurase
MEDFRNRVTDKTKVVAFNYASNAVGTISDALEIIRLAKEAGAITIVDAVHFALHGVIDVRALDADFLFCSAYKFFGPHVGVLFGKRERMEALRTLRVGAQEDAPPFKFETGTLNHEGIAGAAEAVEFIADIGARHPLEAPIADAAPTARASTSGPVKPASEIGERRKRIVDGMHAVEAYEQPLAAYFKDILARIDGLTLYGPPKHTPCTSTIAFRLNNVPPREVAARLGDKGIFTWNGDFYAVQLVKSLGLSESGGLVRIGLAPYNTKEEIDRTLDAIRAIAASKPE